MGSARIGEGRTQVVDKGGGIRVFRVPEFRLRVLAEGPEHLAVSRDGRIVVGTAEAAGLRLGDPTVSRYHLEVEATERGIALRDLGSTNGTYVGHVRISEAVVRGPTELVLGRTKLRLELGAGESEVAASRAAQFGPLVGGSAAMRAVYAVLERAAPTTAPVLITGESGTGKELAAHALHEQSERRSGPFEIVDCGGLPATLVESELFGHERGAFTGAHRDREGAFERAHGGTLFLDELGELPLDVQPKLLRALGEQEVRRVGGGQRRRVDVRVVAATNRDLRREVNSGAFRADLFYRLAVIEVRLPALRQRPEDLRLLVPALLDEIARERDLRVHLEADDALLEPLYRHSWPGNVRELRNYLEQLVILRVPPPLGEAGVSEPPAEGFGGLEQLPLRTAKAQLVERFERHYVQRLLAETDGNVAEAARRAGVDRGTLFRTIRRHGLRED